jgi:hypothetical protein
MGLESLVRRWRKEGLELLPPESAVSIATTFKRVGSNATHDVVALYLTLGGMEIPDDEMVRLWPLKEIEENGEPSDFGVIFADYSLDCWCFRLKPINEAESVVYVDYFDGNSPQLVAKSVLEFWEIYERSPRTVHGSRKSA